MNTYRVTCICVWCSYGGGKLSPYVYLKTRSASSSPVALRAHWSFLYPKINSRKTTPLFSPLPLSLFLPSSFFSLLFCVFLPPNFTFHLDISQLVTDSCSCSPPPRPSPQLVRHSAVPRRAGRSWADCTRGLGRGDHSLLSAQLVLVR